MSIASELTNLEGNIEDSYDAVNDMGGIIPAQRNMDNLDQAIRTIPQNQGTTYTAGNGIDIDANNEISVDNTTVPYFSDLATVAATGDYGDLLNTPTIPAAQIQSDWTQADNTKLDYIKNKPSLATVATSGLYSDLTGTPSLAAVATSGDYDDLLNKPTIPAAQVQSDWNQATTTAVDYIKNKPSLATVATSGSYNDLSNKPTIPAAQVNSDWDAASGVAQILNKPSLATVATSGSYTDLSNKPTIPEPMVVYANDSLHTPTSITDICTDSGLTTSADPADIITTINAGSSVVVKYSTDEAVVVTSYDDHTGMVPDTISFTGQFLSNWKTNSPEFIKFIYNNTMTTWSAESVDLPTVNDATLTIQHNGTTVNTFTANASSNVTANIETIYADTITPTTAVATIGTTQIADAAVATAKIADAAVTSAKIAAPANDTWGNFMTLESGYTAYYYGNGVYQLGKLTIVNLVIKKNSGYFPQSSQVMISTIKTGYRPTANINTYAGFGGEWNVSGAGYCYLSAASGQITVRTEGASDNFVRINIVYVAS